MPKRKIHTISAKAREKRKQLIFQKAREGLSCAQICKVLKLENHIVAYALKKKTALALVSKTNEALEKANENPIATAFKKLVDALNSPIPELGSIEEAHVFPKLRKIRLKLSRELELTV